MPGTILKTRFVPPYQKQKIWLKEDLQAELAKAKSYPLTIVKAGPGAGKSMMLAHYFRQYHKDNFAWYSLDEFDNDVSLYTQNLIAALNYKRSELGNQALEYLRRERENPTRLRSALDIFLNNLLQDLAGEEFYLIIDDFHLVQDNNRLIKLTNYFINHLPPDFHLIISTRKQPNLPDILNWQLKNKVNIISDDSFYLNAREIQDFLNYKYNMNFSPGNSQSSNNPTDSSTLTQIMQMTEGWIMALDLIGRRLQAGQQLDKIISRETDSLELLFEFLAREVMSELDKASKKFLKLTAVLQVLDVNLCDQYLHYFPSSFQDNTGHSPSRKILEGLMADNLFISKYGEEQFRYHQLFQDFLLKKSAEDYDLTELHLKAAQAAEKVNFTGYAIYHYLEAEEYDRSAELLIKAADKLIKLGRIDTLRDSLKDLPQLYFADYPELYLYLGDIYRLQSDFNGALNSYQEASNNISAAQQPQKKAQVWERIARVYLDTVQPARADEYLQQALKLKGQDSPLQEAEFYQLLAENKINEGYYPEAENYLKKARKLSENPDEPSNLAGRVRLRTGRLQEALEVLQEKSADSIPRWHKETALLKSLIYSFLGRQQEAHKAASQGLKLVQDFKSPFTEAVSHMRLGHACQLRGYPGVAKARQHYQKSLELVDEIGIERGRSEPLMGLALLEAYYGDRKLGESYAREGEKLTREAGDEWLTGLLLIALGINQLQQKNLADSRESFLEARNFSKHSYDVFTRIICNYWLTIINHLQGETVRTKVTVSELLALIQENNLGEILQKPTFFTSRDPNRIVPALLAVRKRVADSFAVDRVLGELGYAGLERHPGYSLRIKAFGRGILYRGLEEITRDEWNRAKARELFILFLTNYRDLISRDKICLQLWPDSPPDKAKRNFKVTLNSLKKTLEPDRQPRQQPYFIKRQGSHYGFNQQSSYYYDVEEFENLIAEAQQEQVDSDALDYYLAAVELYRGDFLDQDLYLDFTGNERTRLRDKYLQAMEKIISYFYHQQEYQACIEYCNQALKVDHCWEIAYYYLIRSYLELDKRSMALKTLQRCKKVLQQGLGVQPGKRIQKLKKQFKNS